jgi:hypothetical protein
MAHLQGYVQIKDEKKDGTTNLATNGGNGGGGGGGGTCPDSSTC